jgi:ketosteroid isomerase-like protein
MSQNKQTVRRYVEGFNRTDHAAILSCLAETVEWEIPGVFHAVGKDAFDKQIENEAFIGSPAITVTRMTEEDDVIVAEGRVRCARKDGGMLNAMFCDVFELQHAKITHVTSYLMEIRGDT